MEIPHSIIDMFKQHEGSILSSVWQQTSSITSAPEEQGALPSRLVLDFKDPGTKAVTSVYLVFKEDADGPVISGIAE